MRSHALTSRCLPLIYINTSVIRVFCHGAQDRQTASGGTLVSFKQSCKNAEPQMSHVYVKM